MSFVEDERERLVVGATHAIEAYLSDHMLPLVVQRADGGCIVRARRRTSGRIRSRWGADPSGAPPPCRSYLRQAAARSTV